MTRQIAIVALLAIAVACAVGGAWEASAFVFASGCVLALLGPADNRVG